MSLLLLIYVSEVETEERGAFVPNEDSRVAALYQLIHHMWIFELPKKPYHFFME